MTSQTQADRRSWGAEAVESLGAKRRQKVASCRTEGERGVFGMAVEDLAGEVVESTVLMIVTDVVE